MSEGDDELLEGVASGEPDFGRIYRAYAKDVYAAAQRELRRTNELVDSKDVEDVVHQVFEEAMRGRLLTPDTKSIFAKLCRAATLRARDARRRAARMASTPIEEFELIEPNDGVEDLVEYYYQSYRGQAIWRNQRRLTARERSIVQAYALGESFADIGRRMGLTGQRVGQIFKEASKKLLAGVDLGDGGGTGA